MRAREFLNEQATLPPEQADPMNYVFVLPGVSSSDPYQIYRLGVAIARARSDAGTDGITDKLPAWSAEAAFGEDAVIAGFNASKSTSQFAEQSRTYVCTETKSCAGICWLP